MQMRNLLPALILGLGVLGLMSLPSPAADSASGPADAAKIAKLVEQLGADSFSDRQKASEALDKIGEPALEALRKAASSPDAEVRKRAKDLVGKIETRADSGKLLHPKVVQLSYKDTPVAEAVADFAKKSGYAITLHDPDGKLKGKKVTLDTGKVPFWEALDRFCAAAGVHEGDPNRNGADVPAIGGPAFPAFPLPAPAVPVRPARPIRKPAPAPAPVPPAKGDVKKDAADKPDTPVRNSDDNADATKPNNARRGRAAGAVAEAKARAAAAAAAKVKAQVQIQVQAQPGVAPGGAPGAVPAVPQIAPIGPGGVPMPGRAWVQVKPGQIVLLPGKQPAAAADTTSSVRVAVADRKKHPFAVSGKEIGLVLQVSPEPRLRWQSVTSVQIDRAVDDNGQKLQQAIPEGPMGGGVNGAIGGVIIIGGGGVVRGFPGGGIPWIPPSSNGLHHFTAVKLKKGDKESKSLKELTGTVAGQVLADAEQHIVVENVMKAAGKSVKGKKGGEIKIASVDRADDGTITIKFEFQQPEGYIPETTIPEGQVNPAGGPGGAAAPGGIGIQPGGIRIQPGRIRIQPAVPRAQPPAGGAAKPAPAEKEAPAKKGDEEKPVSDKPAEKPASDRPAEKPAAGKPALVPPAPAVQPVPGGVVIQGNVAVGVGIAIGPGGVVGGPAYAMNGLTLVDGKGKVLRAQITPNWRRGGRIGGGGTMEYVATFKPAKGGDEPAKLVFTGRRMVTLNVPFTLKNVDLK